MRPRMLAGTLAIWVVAALAFLFAGAVLTNVHVSRFSSALGAAAVVGAFNALVWPVVIRIVLPLTVITLGGAVLLLNGGVVLLAAEIVPGVSVDGLWAAVATALILTAATMLATAVLSIDSDTRLGHHRRLRAARAEAAGEVGPEPGILFLEIDGLAYDVLRRALRDGNAPTLARWVREGSHRLVSWETDWSSQTGACQAGLLHGSNDDMPAFRWWEKEHGRVIVTNHPKDAAELERRVSDGRGLLHENGTSRANILSGDAVSTLLTMSTVLDVRRGRLGQDYFSYFASPYNLARTTLLSIADVGAELWSAVEQRRRDVQPRIHRGFKYALVRAWATVVQRDLQVESVLGDVHAGRPVVYTTFLAYDEVAHHSGIERPDALAVLHDLDRQIGRIAAACEEAPRPYRLVVLSDHGQSQGETFLDRYGESLEDLVRAACEPESMVAAEGGDDDALAYLSAGLTEVARDDTFAARTVRAATKDRQADGVVALEQGARRDIAAAKSGEVPELSVMASGCLGLITFPREPGRVSAERIEALYPRLLPALREHPGVGFVMVRSEREGTLVLGPRGTHYLDEERVEGEDPLAPFGPNAARHVRRTDGFPHCPDVMINSTFWPEFGEVAAFEELVGSHGGMGGTQSHPFVLHPSDLEWPAEEVVGAEAVHRIFRGWLAGLGQDAYASEVASPGASTSGSV
ncbi:MAG TPA: phage holin family protein [Solirubrobacterales bacterium]|nr:phage holin family protein [Solirubrobacterales bacterium]